MEETKETKYFHVENVGKNMVTTLIGCIAMGMVLALVFMEWFLGFVSPAEPWHKVLVFVVGFALMFMKDNIKSYIDVFTKKKLE